MRSPGDIAIVGMAGVYPQAPDIDRFWDNILDKVDTVGEAPDGWLGDDVFYNTETDEMPRIYTKSGGFLNELSRFDPRPFGTMPVSVTGGEPDQFMALKVASEALADAGYADGGFNAEKTGIILGHAIHANRANVNGIQHGLVIDQTVKLFRSLYPDVAADRLDEVKRLLESKLVPINVDAIPGLVPNMMTGRIANRLNLMGPNYILDAACASVLVAIETAMVELRTGRADMMLAGGVNSTSSPMVFMVFCQLGALSRSSRVRPFDRSADGTMLGEGLGTVVLKRLEDAERHGDRIYAVVKGVGQSSDGRAMGLMAPRVEGEILAMTRAYEQTGIDPATIGLVEAHGTGIPLGDRTEIEALTRVLGQRSKPYPHVPLGSVKSMVGHSIPASGSASVIKMALALHHKIIPPTLCDEVDPELGIDASTLYVNTETAPWIHAGAAPRRAAINAFGFGGINSHLILEEHDGAAGGAGAAFGLRRVAATTMVALAAPSRAALLDSVDQLRRQADDTALCDIARTAWATRGDGDCRLAVVAKDAADLAAKLDKLRARIADPETHRLNTRGGIYFSDAPLGGKTVFLFPGENSQYPGMLKDLAVAFPQVRDWFDRLESLFAGERDVAHSTLLFPPPTGLDDATRAALEDRLRQVDAGSEAVFFADQALFELLSALGVKPDYLLGHSTGENAALVASGALPFSRDDTVAFIREMNQVFKRVEDAREVPRGVVLSVGAVSRDIVNGVLEAHPDVHFIMDNCPNQVLLFGAEETMATVTETLAESGGICARLPLGWAYHTALIAPMADQFATLFADVEVATPTATLYSCVSAKAFPTGDVAAFRQLAVDQYVNRVRFTEAVENLYADGARVFIEVGPSANLTAFVRDILGDKAHLAVAADQRKRDGLSQLHHLAAQLFVDRVAIDAAPLYPEAAAAEAVPAAPPLPNELPFINLSDGERDRIRDLLGIDAAPSVVRPVVEDGARSDAVASHFRLMDDFLRSQESIALAAAGRGPAAPAVQDWSAAFSLPFAATVQYIDGWPAEAPSFPAIAERLLGPQERAYWDAEIAPRSARRNAEWLLGRLAAKSVARAWLAANAGVAATDHDIIILPDTNGKPAITLAGGGVAPSMSLAHVNGSAVALAAPAGQFVGIDLEQNGRIKKTADVAGMAFSAAEMALMERYFPGRTAESVVLLWSIKEAAAKALGSGFVGQERAYELTSLSIDGQSAEVRFKDRTIMVQARRANDVFCSVAYCPIL